MEAVIEIVSSLMVSYPKAAAVLTVIGLARVIFKPTFTYLQTIADATETKADNELLEKVKNSKAYQVTAYALDLFASVKLPTAKR